ncbi:hypothetical protein AB1Y20_000091 [Prymnesium parvum]|uniref:AMP-dependent synthetase/ligase domain-containing protein n=1 Tax=Prymnesium parvum TaxID=97485 RepID=A0AB34K4E6_PRYPA
MEPRSLLELLDGDGPSSVVPWSKPQLRLQVEAFDLAPWGIAPRARIGLMLPNGTLNATGLLAAMHWHCVVTISPTETALGAEALLRGSGATCLVATAAIEAASAAASAAGVPYVELREARDQEGKFTLASPPAGTPPAAARAASGLEDDVLVLHTSGTTGKKKRVPFSLRRLLASGRALASSLALQPSDLGLNMMPLYHVGGIACNLLCPMVSGSRMIFLPAFSAEAFFDAVSGETQVVASAEVLPPITWCYQAPAMWQKLLQHAAGLKQVKAPRLRILRSGAASLPHKDALALRAIFGPAVAVLPTYSMTECMPICAPPPSYRLEKPGSVGLPLVPLRILDGAARELPPGEVGEITLVGLGKEQLFRGYEKDEAPDAPPPAADPAGDDAFTTGDRGYVDADGWLFHVGRSKECVNRDGELISPVEVEEALLHCPGVVAGEIMAFAAPHAALEEVVGVAVPHGCAAELHQLRAAAAARLPAAHLPQVLVRVAELPRSVGTRKLQRVGYAKAIGLPRLHGSELFTFHHAPSDGTALTLLPVAAAGGASAGAEGGVGGEMDSLSRVIYTPGGKTTAMTALSHLYCVCLFSIVMHRLTGMGISISGPHRWLTCATSVFTDSCLVFCAGWMDWRWPARDVRGAATKIGATLVIWAAVHWYSEFASWLLWDLVVYRIMLVPLPLLRAPAAVRWLIVAFAAILQFVDFFRPLPALLDAPNTLYAKRLGVYLYFYAALPMLMPRTCLAPLPTDRVATLRACGRSLDLTRAALIRAAASAALVCCISVAVLSWYGLVPYLDSAEEMKRLAEPLLNDGKLPPLFIFANENKVALQSGRRFLATAGKFVLTNASILALAHLMPTRATIFSMMGDCAFITFFTHMAVLHHLPLPMQDVFCLVENYASHIGRNSSYFIFWWLDLFAVIGVPLLLQVAVTFYISFTPPLASFKGRWSWLSYVRLPFPQPPSPFAMAASWVCLLVVLYYGNSTTTSESVRNNMRSFAYLEHTQFYAHNNVSACVQLKLFMFGNMNATDQLAGAAANEATGDLFPYLEHDYLEMVMVILAFLSPRLFFPRLVQYMHTNDREEVLRQLTVKAMLPEGDGVAGKPSESDRLLSVKTVK